MESLDEKTHDEPTIKFYKYCPDTIESSYYGRLKTHTIIYELISNNNSHKLVNYIPNLKQTIIDVIKKEMDKHNPKEETDMKKINQGDLNGISIIIHREYFEKSDYSDYDSDDSDIENSVGSYTLLNDTTNKLYRGLSKFLNNVKDKETKILNKKDDTDEFQKYTIYINFQLFDGSDFILSTLKGGYEQYMKRRKERKEEKRKEYERYLQSIF